MSTAAKQLKPESPMKRINNQLAVHNRNRSRTIEVIVEFWELRPQRVYRSVVLRVRPGLF